MALVEGARTFNGANGGSEKHKLVETLLAVLV